jgi:ankyrin repeat protein
MKRAQTYEEIKPLIDLCKAGRLFDVQEWISAGKPVNPPPSEKGYRRKSPLEIAMDCGFHSLVQVLLEGGAAIEEPRYSAIDHALSERRLDLVQLLIKHGADIHSVDMGSVFDTWQPEIMEFFIDRGADVETGNPLAYALCNRIRTALRILKEYEDRFPSFKEQANIALRHHCMEGNLKWVSLMLWAGADPYAKGPDSWDDEPDPDEGLNALEFAALYGHWDVFKLKQIRLDPNHPHSRGILRYICYKGNADFLTELLEKGFNPSELEDCGTAFIQTLLSNMSWSSWSYDDLYSRRPERNVDNSRS